MIKYPILDDGITIGITAPSSGVRVELHAELNRAIESMKRQGFNVVCGETVWTQHKAKSAPAIIRAQELNDMLSDKKIDIIVPPWGGELLIEIIELLNFDNIQSKWIVGYSDISLLLLAVTLKTGMATAHCACMMELRGELIDDTTAMWKQVLSTKLGEASVQYSSKLYQKEWPKDKTEPSIFQLTEPTYWNVINATHVQIKGRLLGGCIDVIRHLIGTPYGDVKYFQSNFINNEQIIWYLENCELNTADLRRSLVQMKLAGWFNHCAGILFGRSDDIKKINDYSEQDVYEELSKELKIPIIFDIDCGHVPPQMTLVNGAYAEIEVKEGKGIVKQLFKP